MTNKTLSCIYEQALANRENEPVYLVTWFYWVESKSNQLDDIKDFRVSRTEKGSQQSLTVTAESKEK